jgi:hypothetical protein
MIHEVEPGQTIHFKFDEGNGQDLKSFDPSDPSETYSISSLRDIVITAAASLFYGRHSQHGLVAVKSLRQRPSATDAPVLPQFARAWEQEKRLLGTVEHVRKDPKTSKGGGEKEGHEKDTCSSTRC